MQRRRRSWLAGHACGTHERLDDAAYAAAAGDRRCDGRLLQLDRFQP